MSDAKFQIQSWQEFAVEGDGGTLVVTVDDYGEPVVMIRRQGVPDVSVTVRGGRNHRTRAALYYLAEEIASEQR
jgi:hypothetical protein